MLQFFLRLRARIEEFESNVGAPYYLKDEEYEQWVVQAFGVGAQ